MFSGAFYRLAVCGDAAVASEQMDKYRMVEVSQQLSGIHQQRACKKDLTTSSTLHQSIAVVLSLISRDCSVCITAVFIPQVLGKIYVVRFALPCRMDV